VWHVSRIRSRGAKRQTVRVADRHVDTGVVGLNADLVQLLLDRDELYMQQDSFLVDIDDLNRFAVKY